MKFILGICFLFVANLLLGQTTWDSLGALPKVTAIQTISPYDSVDQFEDLMFLKEVLKDKRIVMLGESMHGVEDFNEAKTRMIKFLHQEMDFEVVVFESGLNYCEFANKNKKEWSAEKLLKHSILGMWQTPACLALMKYIKKEPNLQLSGVDIQPRFHGDSINMLYNFFKPIYPALAKKILRTEKECNTYWEELPERSKLIKQYQKGLKGISRSEKIKVEYSKRYIELIEHVLLGRIEMLQRFLSYEDKWDLNSGKARDTLMTKNLEWLLTQRYPNKKIIVWAHNVHIRKRVTDHKYACMGELFHKKWAKESYVMGFFYAIGNVCHGPQEYFENTFENIKGNSIQHMIYRLNIDLGYINFKDQLNNKWLNSGLYNVYLPKHLVDDNRIKCLINAYDGMFMCRKARCPEYLKKDK